MKTITVVGSGIVGLTSALMLQEKGFNVSIIAKENHEKTLSNKVGAVWFPFEVHPVEKANIWATLAYTKYESEIIAGNGVSFMPFMIAYTPESDTSWTEKLPKRNVREALKSELPLGIDMAKVANVPLAEPPLYLPHLFKRFIDNGGSFEEREITSLSELSNLDTIIINCTGLGAKNLCDDADLHPMRGQILRCKKMGLPSCVNSINKGALSYIINRSEDCIIGGTDYENDWNLKIEQEDTDLVIKRLKESGLTNKTPEVLEELVGLRPRRSAVRFEFDEKHSNVFHNYGHGGAGFTVAWGCAIELAEIFSKLKN